MLDGTDELHRQIDAALRPEDRAVGATDHAVELLANVSRLARRHGFDVAAVAGIIERSWDFPGDDSYTALLAADLIAQILATDISRTDVADGNRESRRGHRANGAVTSRNDEPVDHRAAASVRQLVAAPSAPPRLLTA
jgi:hypothetical protein